jgi:hypothetical protein
LKSIFNPSSGTGNWLLFMMALFLTPFLIGLILWILYNQQRKTEAATTWWHCESCGWRGSTVRTPRTFKEWLSWHALPIGILTVFVLPIVAWIIMLLFSVGFGEFKQAPAHQQSLEEKRDSKQSKPRRSKIHTRAGNVEGGEDK